MTYSKIDIYRTSILAMICFLVCFTQANQATATKVKIEEFTCWVCETKYSAPVVYSWNPWLGKSPRPNIEPPKCPRCGAQPKWRETPTRGGVAGLMADYLRENGTQVVIKKLVDCCTCNEDVDAWGRLIPNVDYDSWIADIRRSGKKDDNYYKKKFDAADLLHAIDIAKRFKGQSESAERLKNVVISEEKEGYWDRIRALIKANPHLVDDYIALRKQEREEEVAELEKFKRVSQDEKFKRDLLVIVNEAKKQIQEEKQKYLLNLKK